MKSVPKKIVDKVAKLIKKYSLFEERKVYVAYSGGKDSLLLCLILIELGYEVYPITIDIGYGSDWGAALRNIECIGLNSLIIGMEQVNQFMPEIKNKL